MKQDYCGGIVKITSDDGSVQIVCKINEGDQYRAENPLNLVEVVEVAYMRVFIRKNNKAVVIKPKTENIFVGDSDHEKDDRIL